jgi:hypothetical protein
VTATYTFPSGQIAARGVALIPYDGSLLIPNINSSAIFQQSGSTFAPLSLSVNPTGIQGWSCAAVDVSGNAYAAPYASGQLLKLPAGNPAGASLFNLPTSKTWTGLAIPATGSGSGIPYVQAADGSMQALVGSTLEAVTPGLTSLSRGLCTDGTKLYAAMPALQEVAVMTLTSSTTFTSTTIAAPMSVVSCLAASSSGVAIAGWTPSTLTVGASALAASPVSPGTTAAAVNARTNSVMMVTGTEPSWAVTQTISGSGAPDALSWVPNGEQIITADPTNGKVEVFDLTGITLSPSQTITVTDAAGIANTSDSIWAFVPQPVQNAVTILKNNVSTWSISQTITGVSSASSVLATTTEEFVVGQTGALQWFNLNATWGHETTVSGLSFTPVALATDGQGNIYAVGVSGSTGQLAVVNKSGIVATTSWTGSGNAIIWSTGQIMVVDSVSDLIRGFALTGNTLTQATTLTAPAGCSAIGLTQTSAWLCGSSVIDQMLFTAPFTLAPRDSGSVGVVVSGSTHTATLGVEHKPSAVTFDPSGNVWCATIDGQLFEISLAGSILSQTTITPNSPQPAGTPLGISYLLWNNGHLFAASSLCGALIELM